jgi:hypothetical protein
MTTHTNTQNDTPAQAAAPHSRDYYTQAGDTFCTAQNHHFTRLARLRETLDELQTIAEHVSSAL